MTIKELKEILNQFNDSQEIYIEMRTWGESEDISISSEDLHIVEDRDGNKVKKDICIMDSWSFEEYCKNITKNGDDGNVR